MASKKVTYHSKTRNDISNPYNNYSHQELLKIANVKVFNGRYEIEQLQNGRIKVIPSEKDSKKKK